MYISTLLPDPNPTRYQVFFPVTRPNPSLALTKLSCLTMVMMTMTLTMTMLLTMMPVRTMMTMATTLMVATNLPHLHKKKRIPAVSPHRATCHHVAHRSGEPLCHQHGPD